MVAALIVRTCLRRVIRINAIIIGACCRTRCCDAQCAGAIVVSINAVHTACRGGRVNRERGAVVSINATHTACRGGRVNREEVPAEELFA